MNTNQAPQDESRQLAVEGGEATSTQSILGQQKSLLEHVDEIAQHTVEELSKKDTVGLHKAGVRILISMLIKNCFRGAVAYNTEQVHVPHDSLGEGSNLATIQPRSDDNKQARK